MPIAKLVQYLCVLITAMSLFASTAQAVEQVNINTADAATLSEVLSGVGRVKAAAIVEYRKQHGPFQNIEQLKAVKGIGEGLLKQNRDRLLIEPRAGGS